MQCLESVLLILGLAFVAGIGPATAEEMDAMPDISKGWKLQKGDDVTWADPAHDVSDWRDIDVGKTWDDQGMAEFDGYAWYRLQFTMPGKPKDNRDLDHYQSLTITLGKIDDVDRTYFNGEIVGETGSFPESFSGEWTTMRSYKVPLRLVRWGCENVIAVRVYDNNGPGGMYEGPYGLRVSTWRDYLKIKTDLGRGDGVFTEKDGLPIAANVSNGTYEDVRGEILWKVEDDEGKMLAERRTAIELPAGTEKRVACDFAPTAPGMYKVTSTLECNQNNMSASTAMYLAYRPEEINAPLTRESDFDVFWRDTLVALKAVDPAFDLSHRPAKDTATHEVYEVEMRSLGNVRVRGWYEKPKAAGRYPALLRVPGYTMAMKPTGTSDPIAVFSFNIRGHGNSQDDVSGQPEDYWIRGLDQKEGYFYQGAYADCVRAIDFLASRPEVDVTRIAVSGESQGGGLAIATAALDKRISLCAPDIPFLCDFVKYFKASHWPEIDAWIKAEPQRSWEKMLRVMSYFDTLNMADRIKCPVFLGVGLQDDNCPPATIFAVYNRLDIPKTYRVYPNAGHWVGVGHAKEQHEWLMKGLGMDK